MLWMSFKLDINPGGYFRITCAAPFYNMENMLYMVSRYALTLPFHDCNPEGIRTMLLLAVEYLVHVAQGSSGIGPLLRPWQVPLSKARMDLEQNGWTLS